MMTPASTYADYLNDRQDQRARRRLAMVLDAVGFRIESWLLRYMLDHQEESVTLALGDGGAWDGRRVRLGEFPPHDSSIGDIWFDPVEVVPMLLVPKPADDAADSSDESRTDDSNEDVPLDPFAWVSLRPVARWQYDVFLSRASLSLRPVEALPFPPFDRGRIIGGAGAGRVTALTSYEAYSYTGWFGKMIADPFMFTAAVEQLTPPERDAFWYGRQPEWAGWFDEEEAAIVAKAPFPLDDDYAEWEEYFDGGYVATVDNWTAFPDVGFRSAVDLRFGLLQGRDVMPYMPSLGKLVERIPRAEKW
jgi:hypothetical protein